MSGQSKLSIIGAGHVGSALAYASVIRELVDEIVLVNRTHEKAVGEAADLQHASAFVSRAMRVRAGGIDSTAGSDVIVLTHSVPMGKDFSDRMSLAGGNIDLFREWIPPLAQASPRSIFVVVTNPVDVMTYVTWKLSALPVERIIGSGTIIDSVRFRSLLSDEMQIHPDDIRAYILGEHGHSQFPALSVAATGGRTLDRDPRIEQIFETAKQAGMDVFRKKGYTNYAIAMATTLIIESIIRDSRRTLPVSVWVKSILNVEDVCLSIPAVIGAGGVQKILQPEFSPDEITLFRSSAEKIAEVLDRYHFRTEAQNPK
ncbi:MAG: lactate dehydrogenase [Planctomycetota bacterium]